MSLATCLSLIRRKGFAAAGAAAVTATFATAALAADIYPSHPVRIIVPFAPGGATDLVVRLMGKQLTERLGQSFIVENKPGADTALGTAYVAKSPPDGYTILFTNDATFILNPLLQPSLSYNVKRDLAPVAPVSYLNLTLAVLSSLPVNNFKELVAYTKAHSGSLSYGSTGFGSQPQLMGETYKKLTGTDIVHVPYKSTGLALNDTLGGRLVFCFPAVSSVRGFVKDGRMKVLAISGDHRSSLIPDVPTFTELGFKDMDIGAWNAFFAPAATPKDVVAKLNAAIEAALSDPDVAKTLANQGMLPMKQTPAQFASYIQSESDRMTKIIKAAHITLQ